MAVDDIISPESSIGEAMPEHAQAVDTPSDIPSGSGNTPLNAQSFVPTHPHRNKEPPSYYPAGVK